VVYTKSCWKALDHVWFSPALRKSVGETTKRNLHQVGRLAIAKPPFTAACYQCSNQAKLSLLVLWSLSTVTHGPSDVTNSLSNNVFDVVLVVNLTKNTYYCQRYDLVSHTTIAPIFVLTSQDPKEDIHPHHQLLSHI